MAARSASALAQPRGPGDAQLAGAAAGAGAASLPPPRHDPTHGAGMPDSDCSGGAAARRGEVGGGDGAAWMSRARAPPALVQLEP